ncbi:hypothetical protein COT07_03630 [Candidatus Woesearchaeota archaeon CG07_land_8_20_14_0_80_44_23]|nr:MAG: hypothetical protein COT07_03630 [Candidatus Woesearchaeota archaeon CG07_land_8_20_14_0_80_44_23]
MKRIAVAVCIPTKDEEENVAPVAARILSLNLPMTVRTHRETFRLCRDSLKIVFINDNARDSTFKAEKKIARANPRRVFVAVNRRGSGLGNAYLSGFEFAKKKLLAGLVFEMDSDLSHEPEAIPDFLSAISKCNAVFGSRCVKGGSAPGWGFKRRLISRTANLLAYPATGFKIRDVTTGFRLYDRQALDALDFRTGAGFSGYAFQLKAASTIVKKGLSVKEIPIRFIDRKAGKSKLRKKDVLEFFGLAFREIFAKVSKTTSQKLVV